MSDANPYWKSATEKAVSRLDLEMNSESLCRDTGEDKSDPLPGSLTAEIEMLCSI